ncbi:lytic transglycosylase domain-containing protein [Orrella daihaiensis]|uniref:Lytic transglycosylase domain-containing protein n=1 Tax=Orrella daihaiensis TaxID=2782176 RepID=A0ABY4AJ56_9BURK|nr:lytic transglycosylase domain-containing protein [Orrella daihaiensis]UOD50326.1 lytic transglycosylase domain-containing protein [Orrella daihaiensis]
MNRITDRCQRGVAVLQKVLKTVSIALPALLFTPWAASFTYNADSAAAQAVLAAKDAADAKQWNKLPALAAQTQGDILQVYADYWIAEQAVQSAKNVFDVPLADAFLNRYDGTYMADKLRADWVIAADESGAFNKIRDLGEFVWYNREVRCAKLEARHMTGQRATSEEAMADFRPGKACWAMLTQFVADGVMKRDDLVLLLQDALERNHTKTADRVATLLFDAKTLGRYRAMMSSPANWVKQYKGKATGDDGLLVSIGLVRMGRDNPTTAARELETKWSKRLPKEDAGWAWSQLAFQAALDHEIRADAWYQRAGNVRLSEDGNAWRVRAALRQPIIKWDWVQTAIEWMPSDQRVQVDWQYWLARALAAQGKTEQAQAIYQEISDEFHFYGQLALEELGQSIVAPPAPTPVTTAELDEARNNLHLQQAVALFKLGLRREAVPQWNFGLRGLNDRQLLAAAEFAREQQIYDRVVNTSERTQEQVDFSQRFIAPFEDKVKAQANSIDLDPAWVYGLIRQESRFVMDARSVVGASGLMQLMPATAKYVARKIGMNDFRPSRVNEFDVNTTLGTHYLRMVLEDLDGSQVLASAGYNAGPGRPVQWRKTLGRPVEGAIFAETIPFSETRDYVKHVLSNATYYAAVFTGEPQSLKARLGEISPP